MNLSKKIGNIQSLTPVVLFSMMDMMDIEPEKAEIPPNEAEIHEQNQKEIFYDQQPTQKQPQKKKPELEIVPITVRHERPEPTAQQLRRRKQMRRREMEERQANEFLKQPVIKIPNLKKNLKRAYEKNFFDDSKYEYIHTLRKLRKHPQRDSVSSHYGSDESFDIKEHLPKRGFHKRKFAQGDDESSDSDSEKQTRKKRVSKPRQRTPRVKKENVDSAGQPKPRKPRKPRTVSKEAKPTIKVTNKTKPKPEAAKIIKDETKDDKTAKPKQPNKDQSSSEEDLQSDSNSQLSSEKVKAQKISKDPPKQVPIPPKIDNQEKKDLPAKQILEKPAPIPQQIPLKKIVAPNTIIATASKSNLLPPGIAKRPELPPKIATKTLQKQSDSQTSSSQSSSSSSQSSSSDSDSSSDNRHKKKKKHNKSKKHRDSSSDSSDHSKRKKKHKKRKHEESSTLKEVKKRRQQKQELKGKNEPQKPVPIQNKTPQNTFQSLGKQPSNVVSQTTPALPITPSNEKQSIQTQAQKKDAEISNKNIQLPTVSQNVTQPSKKEFKLQSQSLALTLSHKDVPVPPKSQSIKQNEGVSTGTIIPLNPSISNNIVAPTNQSSQVITSPNSKNVEALPISHINVKREFSKETELKFDPKVVVLSLVGSSPSTNQVQAAKEKSDVKQKEVRKPTPSMPAKQKAIKVQEYSDDDSQQSYISYLKRARYPREKVVRLRKVIVQSESDSDSSSQQGYVERRVIKRVRRPQRVVVGSSSQSENRHDYSNKVRVLAKNKNVGQKIAKGER